MDAAWKWRRKPAPRQITRRRGGGGGGDGGAAVDSLFMTSVLKTRRPMTGFSAFSSSSERARGGRARRPPPRALRDQHDEIAPSIKRCSSVRPSVCHSAVPDTALIQRRHRADDSQSSFHARCAPPICR